MGVSPYNCRKCGNSFRLESDLKNHEKIHVQEKPFTCEKCDESFVNEEMLKHHKTLKHEVEMQTEFKCEKCTKIYSTMSKLRRHDWRSHREVSCNICDEAIKSRQDISNHREIKHNMFRKALCKFYPDCLDADECFFSHDESTTARPSPFCPRGDACSDQTCKYSDSNHINMKNILCKFQAYCKGKGMRISSHS